MNILITGAAGFIGYHAVCHFVNQRYNVIGIDNLNDYNSVSLKKARLAECGIATKNLIDGKIVSSDIWAKYKFCLLNIENPGGLDKLFKNNDFNIVIHLAAQAGVRYSLENPRAYIMSNVYGFINILELVREYSIPKVIYASSSSVYGLTDNNKFSVSDRTDTPANIYAATKKSNELMAHVYSHLYDITTIGLRFFTVYGPWGRPDMAPFLFTDAIINNREIQVYNHGLMQRDFTFIDDIIEGIYQVTIADINKNFTILNIGNSKPINLMEFISTIEFQLGKKAKKKMLDLQAGDVLSTWADISELREITGYRPKFEVKEGVKQFIDWYKGYYNVQ